MCAKFKKISQRYTKLLCQKEWLNHPPVSIYGDFWIHKTSGVRDPGSCYRVCFRGGSPYPCICIIIVHWMVSLCGYISKQSFATHYIIYVITNVQNTCITTPCRWRTVRISFSVFLRCFHISKTIYSMRYSCFKIGKVYFTPTLRIYYKL